MLQSQHDDLYNYTMTYNCHEPLFGESHTS